MAATAEQATGAGGRTAAGTGGREMSAAEATLTRGRNVSAAEATLTRGRNVSAAETARARTWGSARAHRWSRPCPNRAAEHARH